MNKANKMKNITNEALQFFATHENVVERRAYRKCIKCIKKIAKRGKSKAEIRLWEEDYTHRRFSFNIHAVVERLANDGFQVAIIHKDNSELCEADFEVYTDWTLEVSW